MSKESSDSEIPTRKHSSILVPFSKTQTKKETNPCKNKFELFVNCSVSLVFQWSSSIRDAGVFSLWCLRVFGVFCYCV